MVPGALLARGVGVALAVAAPAAIAAQVRDVAASDAGALDYVLSLVVLAGTAVGGWWIGRQVAGDAAAAGALVGLLAILPVQALGALRRSAGGHEVAWATIPVVTLLAVGLATGAAVLAARQPGRTRP